MKVGVLALQGAFIEHINALEHLGADCVEIRKKEDIIGIDRVLYKVSFFIKQDFLKV